MCIHDKWPTCRQATNHYRLKSHIIIIITAIWKKVLSPIKKKSLFNRYSTVCMYVNIQKMCVIIEDTNNDSDTTTATMACKGRCRLHCRRRRKPAPPRPSSEQRRSSFDSGCNTVEECNCSTSSCCSLCDTTTSGSSSSSSSSSGCHEPAQFIMTDGGGSKKKSSDDKDFLI